MGRKTVGLDETISWSIFTKNVAGPGGDRTRDILKTRRTCIRLATLAVVYCWKFRTLFMGMVKMSQYLVMKTVCTKTIRAATWERVLAGAYVNRKKTTYVQSSRTIRKRSLVYNILYCIQWFWKRTSNALIRQRGYVGWSDRRCLPVHQGHSFAWRGLIFVHFFFLV